MIHDAIKTDQEQIMEYCQKNGFKFPESNCLYLSKDETGNINGIAGLEIVIKIEPFIADSPIVAKRLYERLLEVLKDKTGKVECFAPNEKFEKVNKLYSKLGFEFAENTNRFIKIL